MDVNGSSISSGMAISDRGDGSSIIERGDGPAQIVIEKNFKAQAQRKADATKEELLKITNRVDKTMAAFELNEKLMGDQKAAIFVPDLIELEKIVSDAILKRRYQQKVMIFIVGYEDVAEQRLKSLTQINDFFIHYINNIDEEELQPKLEVDLEEVSTRVQEAIATAAKATVKLTEIKDEMSSYVDKLQGGKLASKGKKKLEKTLGQAKDDIMNLTEKLISAQTEIEEKEDQMTKLYKQLDVKNLEVLKYKSQSEKAKNNTGQFMDEIKMQLEEKEEIIANLSRVLTDQELTIKQLESMRDSNSLKLKMATEDNQETVEKLESKSHSLQVLLEDTKSNLYKQHKSELKTIKQDHLQEIELLKVEYQEKIDTLKESKLTQWASDSEEESDVASYSRRSNLDSRKSSRLRKDGKHSRQATSVKKSASSYRQPSAVTTPATGETLSKLIPDTGNGMGKPKDIMTRAKSNLEPVHEIHFEGKFSFEDEEQWNQVPKEQIPLAFKQYRKDVLFIVKGLKTEIQGTQDGNLKNISKLEETVKEKEQNWDGERVTLLRQIGTIEKLRQEAEKEADQAITQLEEFVMEQQKVAQLAEAQEKKTLQKLTPEQRAKYMGVFQPQTPSIEDNTVDTVTLPALMKKEEGIDAEQQTIPTATMAKKEQSVQVFMNKISTVQRKSTSKLPVSIATQTDPFPYITPIITTEYLDSDSNGTHQAFRNCRHYSTTSSESLLSLRGDSRLRNGVSGEEGDIEDEGESEEHTLPTNDQSMKSPLSTQWENSEVEKLDRELVEEGNMSVDDISNAPGFDKDRPLSASSQWSLYEKYRAQLERRKADIVERRSRATSMHGSLLSGASGKGESLAPDIPFPEDVEMLDVALSPIALSTSSKESDSSKRSLSYIADHPIVHDYLKTYGVVNEFKETLAKMLAEKADHPIVHDYLKTYGVVNEFKETLAKMLAEKDLLSASEQLADIKQLEFDKEKNVRFQVAEMTCNVEAFIKEVSGIFNALLSNDSESPLSDLLSRVNTSKTRPGVDILDQDLCSSTTGLNGYEPVSIKQLQDKYDTIQQDLLQQRKDYEERLNNNSVVMMEMQDTIQELHRQMAALGASPSKFYSSLSRLSTGSESTVDPPIIFSRLDAERNQKALKRGLTSQKVSSEQYNEAVKIMNQYTILPAKRLVHLVKKYTHHAHMKAIEENVRHSSVLDDEVFQILEKMERLQNLRAQRWGEEMDAMAAERLRLSCLLLQALSSVERESGIFMIKPILSYERRNQFLQYHNKSCSVYRPSKTIVRPLTVPLFQEQGATPDIVPAPTPATSLYVTSTTRRTTQNEPRIVHVDVPTPIKSETIPVMGSSVNLVGTPAGDTWAVSTSVVSHRSTDSTSNLKNSLINTPRILELDINRMLIGQNAVSALTKPFVSNDFLVNAANASVRSYITIARPSARPYRRPIRPSSVGNEGEGSRTPNNTPFVFSKPSSAGTLQRRSSSVISIHTRARSEGAIALIAGQTLSPLLNLNQPLPPIKVPSSGEKGGGDASKNSSRIGSTGRDSVINEETVSQGRASSIGIADTSKETLNHPSPPRTPPGSSIQPSATPSSLPSASSSAGGGHLTKAPFRSSSSRSAVNSVTFEKGAGFNDQDTQVNL